MSTYSAYIGRDRRDGSRVYVQISLETVAGPLRTVDHQTTPSGLRLSITGSIVDKGRATVGQAGQIDPDTLLHLVPTPGTWTHHDLLALAEIWERWHLNDMRAACVHQHGPYGLDKTPPCSETGYRYGSAWLYEDLPAHVYQTVNRLMNLPTGKVPAYV